jgi:hypothetical protein
MPQLGQLLRKDRSVTVGSRIPANLAARLQAEARRRGVSVAFLLAGLIRDCVNDTDRGKT